MLTLFGISSIAAAQQATASSADELVTRYPKGSIQTTAQADRVLAEVTQARARTEIQFNDEQRECYRKFFVSDCVDAAKERHRMALNKIAPIEVEATIFKRKANVAERDQALAEKQVRDQADAEERLKKLPENERAAAEKTARVERKVGDAQSAPDVPRENTARIQEHAAHLNAQQRAEADKAPERAQNAADYQKKVQEAQERQRKIAEKKQKKEAERKAREAAAAQ
ncbi:MAG: hypothetical protein JSS58_07105 [Proteobacteria bacterium]|nr:hypothetical protein [Pseudomonadota bacterium]